MKTEIDFLRELEGDLLLSISVEKPGPTPRRRSRRPFIAAGIAMLLAASAGVGFYFNRSEATRVTGASADADTSRLALPSESRRNLTVVYDALRGPARWRILGPAADVPLAGPNVVKVAKISVVVEKATFGSAFEDASLVASQYGGFVESSSTQGADSRSGRLVLRIPVQNFDLALADLRDLGRVDGESVGGQDVTARFVDLQARLRGWQAQETVLLRLMRKATTVSDSLRVRGELQDVQVHIEELTAQVRLLEDQTEMSTISVALREAGVSVQAEATDGRSLRDAWGTTVDGFLAVVFAMLIGLGYLVPVLVVAVLGWLLWRRTRAAVS